MTAVERINASANTAKTTSVSCAVQTNSDPITNGSKNIAAGDTLDLSGKKLTFDEMLEQGILEPEKKSFLFFKVDTGKYIYKTDGEKTYGEIKNELQLEDGVLRKRNPGLFDHISGNADSKVPGAGTTLKIDGKDFPSAPVDFTNENGEDIRGFYKRPDGGVYYQVKSGDTQESIYKMLSDKAFKDYKTTNILEGYPDTTLAVGTKIDLQEKSWFGKLFS